MPQIFALYCVYRDGRTILQKDFQIEETEADLVTGFLSAVSIFLSDLVGRLSEEGQKLRTLEREDGRLRIIDREDVKILLEYGKNIYAAVFSTHDLDAIRQRMRTLITSIEIRRSQELENWSGDLRLFDEFIPLIEALFRPFAVSERYVPVRIHTVPTSRIPSELHSLVDAIDDTRSLSDLSKHLQVPFLQVMLDVQVLKNHGAIQLERRIAIEQLVSYSK